jgi:hypothetical protein
VKFFGRHKGGAIRDGVLLSVGETEAPPPPAAWPCHGDEATAVMDGEAELISAFRFPARSQPMKSEPGPPMPLGNAAGGTQPA